MKTRLRVTKGFDVIIRSQEKTFEHDARAKIQLDYGDLSETSDDEEVVEAEAQEIAKKINNYINRMGVVTTPKHQYEGEITMNVAVKEGHTAEEIVSRVGSIISVVRAKMEGENIEFRAKVRERRLGSIMEALQGYKGEKIDDGMVRLMAEDVLKALRKSERER